MLNKIKKIDATNKKLIMNISDFLKEYSVLGVAIGVIFAQSAKDFVDSLVKGFFIPLFNLIIPSEQFLKKVYYINGVEFNIGNIASTGLSFLIVIFILYFAVKKVLKTINNTSKKNLN